MGNKPLVSIFTPTYNRARLLQRLYYKLCEQTCKQFIWLIVDDGSTDDTRDIVESFSRNNGFDIIYIFQKNSGKQRAVNTALNACTTECFAFCDSDDWYIPTTLNNFIEDYSEIANNSKVAGVVARRGNGQLKCKMFPKITKERMVINLPALYEKYNFHAETCAMFKTSALRTAMYPVIEDKFIPESYMFDKYSQKFDVLFVNKVYSVSEYLADGLTVLSNELYHRNPMGVYYALREATYTNYGLLKNIKNGASLLCWKKKYKINENYLKEKQYVYIVFYYLLFIFCYAIKKPSWIWNKNCPSGEVRL